jgi:hypothetical protein
MIILGIVLLLLSVITGIAALGPIGLGLIVIGAILWVLGAVGHQVGRRPHYY